MYPSFQRRPCASTDCGTAVASAASMAMPARQYRCIFLSPGELPKRAGGTLRLEPHVATVTSTASWGRSEGLLAAKLLRYAGLQELGGSCPLPLASLLDHFRRRRTWGRRGRGRENACSR